MAVEDNQTQHTDDFQRYSNSGSGDMEMEALRSSTPGNTNGYSKSEVDPESPNPQHDPPGNHVDDDEVERTSNMWIAAAYNITAIVGVGVLGLPQAMVFLTWGPGVVILLLALCITYFTLKQLTKLHEFEFHENRRIRYETYYRLGQRAFGTKAGLLIILPLQMVVEISLDILFTVVAGEAMNRIYDNYTECNPNPVHIFVWFAVFAAIQIVLSLKEPTFESIKWIVVTAAIMSICYSTIAWITVLAVGGPKEQSHSASGLSIHVNYTLPKHLLVDHCVQLLESSHSDDLKLNHTDLVFRTFNAIGVVAFAYAAHNVVLEIQNGIPSTPHKSSEIEMLRGVKITYAVVAICYLPMGIAFYKIYGNQISQNALSFLQYQTGAPRILVTATNIMLIIHLIGSYQIFGMPVFKLLEMWYKILIEPLFNGSFPFIQRSIPFIIRPLYIVFTLFLAMLFPYFSPLLGCFGGLVIAPTTYFLPCIIWLRIKQPPRWSKDWCLNWACIILGVILMIVASTGGLYVLIKSNKYMLWTKNWQKYMLYLTTNKWNDSSLSSPNTWQNSSLYSTCNYDRYKLYCGK